MKRKVRKSWRAGLVQRHMLLLRWLKSQDYRPTGASIRIEKYLQAMNEMCGIMRQLVVADANSAIKRRNRVTP